MLHRTFSASIARVCHEHTRKGFVRLTDIFSPKCDSARGFSRRRDEQLKHERVLGETEIFRTTNFIFLGGHQYA